MSKTCAFCNILLVQKDRETDEKFQQRKHCNKACQLKVMQKNNAGNTYREGKEPANKGKKMPAEFCENASIRAKKERVEKIIVKCDTCKTEMKMTPSKAAKSKFHFCSRKCRGEWDSISKVGLMTGPKHPLFGTERPQYVKDAASIANLGMSTWNKGAVGLQHHSEESKKLISNALTGVQKSVEHRISQSMSKKGEKNPQFGKLPWNFKIPVPEETLEKIREARFFQKNARTYKQEKILYDELERLGIGFEKHVIMDGHADAFVAPDLCIFVDGVYDHAHPQKYAPGARIRGNKIASEIRKHDQEVTEMLEELGCKVIRFWGDDIEKNLASCIDVIVSHMKSA